MSAPRWHDIGLERKRAFLSDPRSYPERTASVDVIETHMALVFLTDRHAYKLKKPVHHDFLDFRKLEFRHRVCLEEIRLNRRLAPETYLGIVALTAGADDRLQISGPGRTVDWLVYMLRLPAEKMLDAAIRSGSVAADELLAVARLLADFYRRAPVDDVSGPDYRARLEQMLGRNVAELGRYPEFAAPARSATTELRAFIHTRTDLLDERALKGRIVEGHGDLRPEHVCLTEPPVVIDCLEFEPAFRLVDPADELAFLTLECELAGAGWVGQLLTDETCALMSDQPPPVLLDFYKGMRAMLRATLALSHLRDVPPAAHRRWRDRTQLYLETAARYAAGLTHVTRLP